MLKIKNVQSLLFVMNAHVFGNLRLNKSFKPKPKKKPVGGLWLVRHKTFKNPAMVA